MPAYVYHGATGAGDGTSWTDAYTSLIAAIAARAAGEEYWLASDHDETNTSTQTYGFKGTIANPDRCLSVNRSTDALEAGALIKVTGDTSYLLFTGSVYVNGVTTDTGTSSDENMTTHFHHNTAAADGEVQVWENCTTVCRTSRDNDAGPKIGMNTDGAPDSEVWLINHTFDITGHASKRIYCYGRVRIIGGGIAAGTSIAQEVFSSFGKMGTDLIVIGFDMSECAAGTDIHRGGNFCRSGTALVFSNIEVPASWTGGVFGTAPTVPLRAEVYNFGASGEDASGKLWFQDYPGQVREETTIVRSGGAAISRKMTTITHTGLYPSMPMRGPTIRKNVAAGTVDVAVHAVLDSATALDDDEFWIEVMAFTTSGIPISTLYTSRVPPRTTAATLAASTESWGTTGFTNEQKRKALIEGIVIAEAGYIEITPCLARSACTLYYCPDPEIA